MKLNDLTQIPPGLKGDLRLQIKPKGQIEDREKEAVRKYFDIYNSTKASNTLSRK